MHGAEDEAMAPEAAAALLAIDATLAGDPVDPEHAELARLALSLREGRPEPSAGFVTALDARVQRRFAPAAADPPRRRRARSLLAAGGVAVAAMAAVAAGVVIAANHPGSASRPLADVFASSSSAAAGSAAPAASSSAGIRSAPSAAASSKTAQLGAAPTPAPSPKRQIVQSAQLALAARPGRIDDVAQQVFNVIGAEHGIVDSSNITATGNAHGDATFQLRVPSSRLSATMTALSRLRGAAVVSRRDTTADITARLGGAGQRLAEARALRRGLLKQLAAATTTQAVDTIKLRLRRADASIASDVSRLGGLRRRVAYSRIAVTIQTARPPAPPPATGGSFTLGRAAHDAGRVLVVVAGGALIALAVLVPVGLVVALATWIGLLIRRRRREQALDLV